MYKKGKTWYWNYKLMFKNLLGLLVAIILIALYLIVSTIEFRGL